MLHSASVGLREKEFTKNGNKTPARLFFFLNDRS
jgi:hypothetical protein